MKELTSCKCNIVLQMQYSEWTARHFFLQKEQLMDIKLKCLVSQQMYISYFDFKSIYTNFERKAFTIFYKMPFKKYFIQNLVFLDPCLNDRNDVIKHFLFFFR